LDENSFGALQNTERLFFRTLLGTGTDFFFRETFTVIYGSIQLGELIQNITLVLRKNASIFAKLTIPGQESGFLRNHQHRFCSLVRHGAMINDKSRIGE
jgi:hypothetical protein